MSVELSIIIVNWNSVAYLRRCIASILAHTKGIEFEILVVDAGSFDGCESMLRTDYPWVRFIQSPVNCGFAAANNLACEQATGRTLLFLNPDTELLGNVAVSLHAALHSSPEAGLVGAKLLNTDGTLQSTCVLRMPTLLNQLLSSAALREKWPRASLWGTAPLYARGESPRVVEAISGACLMVRRSTFDLVGRFSEDYFMYAEDIDLAHKVRKTTGQLSYYVPTAILVHHGGCSSSHAADAFGAVMLMEATWRFLRKTRGGFYGLAYRGLMLLSALIRLGLLAVGYGLFGRMRLSGRNEASHRKWRAILRWSRGSTEVVGDYYGMRSPAAEMQVLGRPQ